MKILAGTLLLFLAVPCLADFTGHWQGDIVMKELPSESSMVCSSVCSFAETEQTFAIPKCSLVCPDGSGIDLFDGIFDKKTGGLYCGEEKIGIITPKDFRLHASSIVNIDLSMSLKSPSQASQSWTFLDPKTGEIFAIGNGTLSLVP